MKVRSGRIGHSRAISIVLLIAAVTIVEGCRTPPPAEATPSAVIPGPPSVASPIEPQPPLAERVPYTVPSPNGDRPDPYYWIRDDSRRSPQMLAYLAAENDWTRQRLLDPTKALRENLFKEMVAHVQQDDSSVPVRIGDDWYARRYAAGQEYPVYLRHHHRPGGPEQILLDGPAMSQGHDFFTIGSDEPSPNGRLLAYTEDIVGRRQFVLHVRDLQTGRDLADTVPNVEPNLAWTSDNHSLLYIEKDPVTLLSTRVKRHRLGTDASRDDLVYEESDKSFYLSIERSKSGRFLYIDLRSTLVSEVRYANAGDPKLKFQPVLPREPEHEYEVADLGRDFIIRTNWRAPDFRIVRAPIASSADKSTWRDLIAGEPTTFIQDFDVSRAALAVSERNEGHLKVFVKPWDSSAQGRFVSADEPDYTMQLQASRSMNAPVRYAYTSLLTPATVFDFDASTGKRTLLKRDQVPGDFDPARYSTEFVWMVARDGTRLPVSLLYRKDLPRGGSAPLYQYGYGSYGFSTDVSFSANRLSLVDRGFVFAIAHVRGGEEMGRDWYEDGKLLNKRNTFTDFIDVTDGLVRAGYAAPDKVFAMGGSAGGLLMGAVSNLAPEKYRGIVAHVPFVDVVTTMLDESIPLTTNEFDEWGNPKQKIYYDYMLSYSPYDNIEAKRYPAMLVTTGLWDSQVQYYEPTKWVAKLRAMESPDSGPLYLQVNMEAGHGGKSGRYQRLQETATEYAFVLRQLGITQ